MPTILPWSEARHRLQRTDTICAVGRVTDLVGMVVEIGGLTAPVGSLCRIRTGRNTPPVLGEVVGFRESSLLVMPYGTALGVATGMEVSSGITASTMAFDLRVIFAQRDMPSRVTANGPRENKGSPSKLRGSTTQMKRMKPFTIANRMARFRK